MQQPLETYIKRTLPKDGPYTQRFHRQNNAGG